MSAELTIDPDRLDKPDTGFYVRAKGTHGWASYDVAHLDRRSLILWLSRDNLALKIALALLDHPIEDLQ